MIYLNFIRENKDLVIEGLNKKNFRDAKETVELIIDLDIKRRAIKKELDENQHNINLKSTEIVTFIKNGNIQSVNETKKYLKFWRSKNKEIEVKLKNMEEELHNNLIRLPNIPHKDVPYGKTPQENVVVFEYGNIPNLPSDALPHWDLIKKYDIVDFDLGNKITGSGFPVYKGKGAKLQRALINFFIDEAIKNGYVETQIPIVVNYDSAFATGQLPDKDGQMYHIKDDDLYLIPTAEVPITNIYRNVILSENDLPIKNVGFTPCFRREAGNWGADVRGLNRLHQFDKVEIVQISLPENSYDALNGMVEHVKNLLIKLELPFRILKLCGGDMSFTSALTYDFEVYSGAQKKWLEVSSVSNFETFQSNRLKLRYKKDGKSKLLHTLNGSALALPRIVAALLENNQTKDGVTLPSILNLQI
jgi:seryl-tRNA synthetase